MNSKFFISRYNLFYLAFCIIWPVVHAYYLRIDGGGRMILLFSVVALLLNFGEFKKKKQLFGSSAFKCWTILVVYSLINSMIKGFVWEYGTLPFIQSNFFISYVFLFVAIIQLDNDKFRCLKVVLFACLFYLIIGSLHINIIQFDRSSNDELGNALPIVGCTCVFVAGILLFDRKLKGGWAVYIAIIALVLAIIIISATRKALGTLVLIMIGVVLGRVQKLNLKTIISIGLTAIVLYKGLQFVMDNTLIGERIEESSENYSVPLSSNPQVNKFLMTLLGDRSGQYYECINLHHQYPLTGVGIRNYMVKTHSLYPLHTEYMVQYFENGYIGLVLLLLFYIFLLVGLNRKRKTGSNVYIYFFGLLSVMFLNLTAWTYNSLNVMFIYATLIAEIYSSHLISKNQMQHHAKAVLRIHRNKGK